MIIIYYRDADGKIVRAHTAPEIGGKQAWNNG